MQKKSYQVSVTRMVKVHCNKVNFLFPSIREDYNAGLIEVSLHSSIFVFFFRVRAFTIQISHHSYDFHNFLPSHY